MLRGVSETIRATAGWCAGPGEWKLCPRTSGFLVKGLCREKPAHLCAALASCHISKHEPAPSGQLDLLKDSANDKAASLWVREVVKLSESIPFSELLWGGYKCRTSSFALAKTKHPGQRGISTCPPAFLIWWGQVDDKLLSSWHLFWKGCKLYFFFFNLACLHFRAATSSFYLKPYC